MAFLGRNIGILSAFAYFLSTLVSFFVVIPVGITLRNFHGSCILYAQPSWDLKRIWPWAETTCDFVLYMNLSVTLLYSFWMGIYTLFMVVPLRWPFGGKHAEALKNHESHQRKFIMSNINPVFILVNGVICVMVLASALTLNVGLDRFCQFMLEALQKGGKQDPALEVPGSCADVQGIDWSMFQILRGSDHGMWGNSFFICLTIAGIANWILICIWVFQWGLNFMQGFTLCSCEVAEEKRKYDRITMIAQRRSRLATPIGTPGNMTPRGRPGQMTPVMYAQGPPGQFVPPQGQYRPPQGQYGPPQGQRGPPQGQYGPPQGQQGPPQGQFRPPGPGFQQSGPPPQGYRYPNPQGGAPPPSFRQPPNQGYPAPQRFRGSEPQLGPAPTKA